MRIEPSGAVSAQIGIVSQGQGHLTTVAQALADELAVPIEQVRVLAGDTAAAPYGMGTRGSRGGVVSAGAALGAARILKEKLLRIAAHLLETPLEDLELADGRVRVRGAPESGFAVAQLAQKAYLAPMELPPGMEPGLEATHAYDPPPLTFSSGTHLCEVEIDRETGGLDDRALPDRRGLREDAEPARRRGAAARRDGPGARRRPVRGDRLRRGRPEPERDVPGLRPADGRHASRRSRSSTWSGRTRTRRSA